MSANLFSRITRRAGLPVLTVLLPLAACSKEASFSGGNANQTSPKVAIDKEFPAALIGSESLKVTPQYGSAVQQFALAEKPPVTRTLKQVERAVVTDPFTQGNDGDRKSEPFKVSALGKLDLLIVVDNSGSMGKHQSNLSTKLASLTTSLATTDWQIAVVTTDSSCLRNGKVIKKSDTTAATDFELAVSVGTDGSFNERGIHFALQALKGKCEMTTDPATNTTTFGNDFKWLRDDAALGVLIVSDEDDYCSQPDSRCPAGSFETQKDLFNYMTSIRTVDKLRAYALVWDQRLDNSCERDSTQSNGTQYEALVKAFRAIPNSGGLVGSICSNNFSNDLAAISQNVARSIKREFALQFEPEAKSLTLTLDGQPFNDFTIIDKKITLNTVMASASDLVVTYRYGSKPKFDHFHLSAKPDASTIAATVNGVAVSASKLTYDDVTRELVFSDLPADSAAIAIKYRGQDAPLRTQFDAAWTDMAGAPVMVSLGTTPATGVHFDPAAKVISFDEPPADGTEIRVSYKTVGGQITSYAAQVRADAPLRREPTAVDASTGAPVNVKLVGDQLEFDAADVHDGRAVKVSYDYGDPADTLSHDLVHTPIDGSVTVHAQGPDGQDCVDHVGVVGSTVTFGCTADKMGDVEIAYKYVAATYTTFTVDGAPAGVAHWDVFVDGVSVPFQRDGNTVTVDQDKLKLDSKVRVLVTKL